MNRQTHTLNEYLELMQKQSIVSDFDLMDSSEQHVHKVTFNSKEVTFGTLFICKGVHFKEEYLKEAIDQGAVCYVSEKRYDNADIPCIIVNDMRTAMAMLADTFYNQAWSRINMIGLTGTKGKSTTAYFLKAILDDYSKAAGEPETAVLSSIDTYDGKQRFESHLTTPEAVVLHGHIDNAVKSGIRYMTMEVSSQALKYKRTQGIVYEVGSFLNLGEDHISPIEHPTFEDYAESKLILFDQCRTCIVNADSDYAEKVIERAKSSAVTERIITFGTKDASECAGSDSEAEADIVGYDIRPDRKGITFCAKGEGFDDEFRIGLTGIFNVSNALCAIAIAYSQNIPIEYIKSGLKRARVSGRMEVFSDETGDLTVIVDYAHNVMSMQALFDSTKKEYPDSHITIVFGCPGTKAIRRRKELGEIAGRYADMCYLTEEDPGEEDVHSISEEIAVHVAEAGGRYVIIDDREEAIKKAIDDAKNQKTVILVTAKGRETRQKRGLEYIDVESDVDIVKRVLKEL